MERNVNFYPSALSSVSESLSFLLVKSVPFFASLSLWSLMSLSYSFPLLLSLSFLGLSLFSGYSPVFSRAVCSLSGKNMGPAVLLNLAADDVWMTYDNMQTTIECEIS